MHPFHLFTLQLAHHLPGTWTTVRRWYPRPADQSLDLCQVWTPFDARPVLAGRLHAAALLGPDDLELYLVEHRRDRVLACPVIPYGLHEDVTDLIPAPPAVAAPRDPVRAAWRITDRVLPHHTAALASAREATRALKTCRASAPAPLPAPAAGTFRAIAR
ncbi:hypothetical protein [Streptomyces sp. C10-9-1]|uniref:hypothetical protein n=1 Tax=Streptomyces sp. C10-9-1 TaxID=1859285 RepID=UPI003F4A61A2